MNTSLVNPVGSIGQDNLIARLHPAADTTGIKIRRATGAEVTYKRGTVLAVSSADGYAVILGTEAASTTTGEGEDAVTTTEELTPSYILADDVTVPTTGEATAVAYRCGNFNTKALIVADGYTMTVKDRDALRHYDIILNDMMD